MTKSETSYTKWIILGANTFFAVIGFIYLTLKPLLNKNSDQDFNIYVPVGIFGLLLLTFCYLGYFSKWKNDEFMVIVFSACLLVTFIAEMSVGLSSTTTVENHKELLIRNMIQNYKKSPEVADRLQNEFNGVGAGMRYLYEAITSGLKSSNAFVTDQEQWPLNIRWTACLFSTSIQSKLLKCCGINGPGDWNRANQTIPSSCCGENTKSTCEFNLAYTIGCIEQLAKLPKNSAVVNKNIMNTNSTLVSPNESDTVTNNDSNADNNNSTVTHNNTNAASRPVLVFEIITPSTKTGLDADENEVKEGKEKEKPTIMEDSLPNVLNRIRNGYSATRKNDLSILLASLSGK